MHVQSFVLAVAKYIVTNFVLPYGSVSQIGSTPVMPYYCPVCQKGFMDKGVRDFHKIGCLQERLESGKPHELPTFDKPNIKDFHLDFIWKYLFRREFSSRVSIGDGHRLDQVLLRYMTLLYEGSHSTNMVRETIRRQAQTEHRLLLAPELCFPPKWRLKSRTKVLSWTVLRSLTEGLT